MVLYLEVVRCGMKSGMRRLAVSEVTLAATWRMGRRVGQLGATVYCLKQSGGRGEDRTALRGALIWR